MPKELKNMVLKLLDDISTIETAIVSEQEDNSVADVLTYSKVELEGDAINYLNQNCPNLHNAGIKY